MGNETSHHHERDPSANRHIAEMQQKITMQLVGISNMISKLNPSEEETWYSTAFQKIRQSSQQSTTLIPMFEKCKEHPKYVNDFGTNALPQLLTQLNELQLTSVKNQQFIKYCTTTIENTVRDCLTLEQMLKSHNNNEHTEIERLKKENAFLRSQQHAKQREYHQPPPSAPPISQLNRPQCEPVLEL